MKKRPVNLDLRTIKFPITAIVSILHRISGLILFLMVPFALWALNYSLNSAENLKNIQDFFGCSSVKIGVFLFLASLFYHLIAGIRHLLMDIGLGETIEGGRRGAKIVLLIFLIIMILVGVWLW